MWDIKVDDWGEKELLDALSSEPCGI